MNNTLLPVTQAGNFLILENAPNLWNLLQVTFFNESRTLDCPLLRYFMQS